MRQGGRRLLVVPPELGFGEQGADLGGGRFVPGGSTIEYDVQLTRVSVTPS